MRATNLKIILAVFVLLFTITFTVEPARADVNITATQVGETNEVIISYDATSETNLVRAFSFDIQLDNDCNIVVVTGINADYYIYPGTIQIDALGNVIDYGTALAEYSDLPSGTLSGLDSNGVTIEMASLYSPVGPGSPNAPAKSGNLLSLKLSKSTCLTISGNVARAGATGVVMEDPSEIVQVNFPGLVCVEFDGFPPCNYCMHCDHWAFQDWVYWGFPACWCYARQCRGDSDGIKTGPFWVAIPDLNAFRLAFNKTDIVLDSIPNGICSDFDKIKTGPFRVAIPDLNIFRLYFNKPELQVPECPTEYYNYWETP